MKTLGYNTGRRNKLAVSVAGTLNFHHLMLSFPLFFLLDALGASRTTRIPGVRKIVAGETRRRTG